MICLKIARRDKKGGDFMKKILKKISKPTVQSFNGCSCRTCSGCSRWGTNGGAATATGSPK